MVQAIRRSGTDAATKNKTTRLWLVVMTASECPSPQGARDSLLPYLAGGHLLQERSQHEFWRLSWVDGVVASHVWYIWITKSDADRVCADSIFIEDNTNPYGACVHSIFFMRIRDGPYSVGGRGGSID